MTEESTRKERLLKKRQRCDDTDERQHWPQDQARWPVTIGREDVGKDKAVMNEKV